MNLFELFFRIGAKDEASGVIGKIAAGFRGLARIGGVAITAATGALVSFGTDSVKTGERFDKSMSQVAATMGMTVEQLNASEEALAEMTDSEREAAIEAQESFGKLRDFAQEMGAQTKFSASESADALNYMALAGYDAETSIAMLPNVLNLAASGDMDLARASDMVTDAQSALGLTLEETNMMVDQMAKTASKSNTSVEQLGDAMLTIGGTATLMSGGTDRLSTVLGILADNGIKGSEAGTHLRNMLLKLSSPTKDGEQAMKDLNLQVFDSNGNMRDMQDIITDLGESLEGMSDEKKIKYISDLFNARDIAAVNALLNTSTDRWNELGEAIVDSQGAAEKMANMQLDNLAGDVTIFQSALEGAKIAISDVLTPTIREFVQFGTDGIQRLTKAFKGEDGLNGAMTVFGDLLSQGVSMMMAEMPNIVMAAVELVKAFGKGIADNIDIIVSTAVQVITYLAQTFIENLPQIIETGLKIIVSLVTGIAKALPDLIPAAVSAVLTIVDGLIDNIDLLIDAALQLILGLAEGLIKAIPKLIEKAPEIIEKLTKALIEAAPKILEAAFELVVMLIKGILDSAKKLIETGFEMGKKVGEGIGKSLSTVFEKGKQLGKKLKEGWDNAVSGVKQWATDLTTKIGNGISAGWASLKNTVSERFNSLVNVIKAPLNAVIGFVREVVEKLKNMFKFEWKLPKIKLPHFKVEEGMKILGITLPRIKVEWYKKAYEEPYMFNSPTVLGTPHGAKGFGDGSGAEMVYGRDNLMRDIQAAVAGMTGITINVYAREGQSAKQIALEVQRELVRLENQRKAAALA